MTDDGKFIEMINELEMIGSQVPCTAFIHCASMVDASGNELWANIYGTDCLARIDKTSGSVTGWLVLQGILDRQSHMPAMDPVLKLLQTLVCQTN